MLKCHIRSLHNDHCQIWYRHPQSIYHYKPVGHNVYMYLVHHPNPFIYQNGYHSSKGINTNTYQLLNQRSISTQVLLVLYIHATISHINFYYLMVLIREWITFDVALYVYLGNNA